MYDVHGTHNYLSRDQPDVQNLLCLIPKHGKYEFLADLKKFVTLSSFPHYGEKTKNDKVFYYKAVQGFIAMKTISELDKNMNWLISKSLELFKNKSILLLKQGLNILFQRKENLFSDNLTCSTSPMTLFSYLSFSSLPQIKY